MAPGTARFVEIDTKPTPLDTEITLFGSACPASDAEAVARNDDAYGLSAALAIDTQRDSGVRFARVRNLGHAGRAVARLDTAGAFIGRITDEVTGSPLGAYVQAVTPDGYYANGTNSDGSTGLYLLSADPGSYYVYVNGPWGGGYVAELYPDAPCGPSGGFGACDVADATLLTLGDGQQLAGIDVALNYGARIVGTVRDATTGAPLLNAIVQAYDASGQSLGFATGVDAAGRYTLSGFLTGTAYVLATADSYSSQIWNHVACGGPTGIDCDPTTGTPLAVVRNQLTTGIDFDLSRGAYIDAQVSFRGGHGLQNGAWNLTLYDASGAYYTQFYAYGSTAIETGAIPPGSYFAAASVPGYFGQLWNGIDCPRTCDTIASTGTPVTIPAHGHAALAFSLLALPTLSGTITDAATHAPIPDLSIALVPVDPSGYTFYTQTDGTGRYAFTDAFPGAYYAFASTSLYRPTVYPAAACTRNDFASCDLDAATPLSIVYGGSDLGGIDMALPANGSIAGRVLLRVPDGMTLTPLVPAYEYVYAYDPSGSIVGSTSIGVDGSYVIAGLPAGNYHVIATGYSFDQAYPGIDCTGNCVPTAGTPLALAQGQSLTGIDFDPYPIRAIYGRVTNANGAGVGGAAIDFWQSINGAHCGVGSVNADGYYVVTDPYGWCYGPFKLSTDIDGPYVNQVYDHILCPNGPAWLGLCDVMSGTDVSYPTTPSFTIANFALGAPPDPIFANGFER
jgi:hypothetical protein